MASDRLNALASRREVHSAFDWFRKNESFLLEQQIELLRIPAPPFQEQARAAWLREQFASVGLDAVRIDDVGNVIGVHPGASGEEDGALLLSAHIDTVFPPDTVYEVTRSLGGYGTRIDAPGSSDNAVGVIALLAIATVLRDFDLQHPSDIVFVANVGEEGEGDLRGMRHLFASEIGDRVAFSLVLDGTGTDAVVTEALGSRRFEVTMRGPGGHSWLDYGRPNPVYALARAISLLQDSPIPTEPRTSVNVGMISGGTSVNTIPETATMRVDVRSVAASEIQAMEERLHACIDAALRERGKGIEAEVKVIGNRPAGELRPSSQLLQTLREVDAHLGIRAKTKRSSTDANIPLSLGKEAVSIGAGGSGGGAHTLAEWFDGTGRDLALKRILLTALLLSDGGHDRHEAV